MQKSKQMIREEKVERAALKGKRATQTEASSVSNNEKRACACAYVYMRSQDCTVKCNCKCNSHYLESTLRELVLICTASDTVRDVSVEKTQ